MSSVLRSTFDCESRAATSSSSCSSFSARTKSPAERGLKTTPAEPAGVSPSSVSSVTAAVERAKMRSDCAGLSFFRPKRTSRRPTLGEPGEMADVPYDVHPADPLKVDRPPHLPGDLGQRREALLERRVRREELAGAAPHRGRDDEERVHRLHLAQVALRN